MEAATSAPAVGYTVEQVRAQQNDRIFRRAVQNLHVQIIEVTGEHARTHAHARDALEKLPEKDIDRAQSERRMRIFVAAKALTWCRRISQINDPTSIINHADTAIIALGTCR
jgi:hypothetical protein